MQTWRPACCACGEIGDAPTIWTISFLPGLGLLRGQRGVAAQHFACAQDGIERYRAQGRLDFEMQLACELGPSERAWLLQEAIKLSGATSRLFAGKISSQTAPPRIPDGTGQLLGVSAGMKVLRETVHRLADLDTSVLIIGETGTGKELVARALHEESGRKNKPFLAINCGAIADSLLESELFGHERGAFTGADKARRGLFVEAGKGTLFLDEIGNISSRLQGALLRVLETGEIRSLGADRTCKIACRVIMATNANLQEQSQQGLFRKDLLYRLERLQLHLIPLREHSEDVVVLADHFLNLDRAEGIRATMSEELRERLQHYDWPGNVRELRNEIERMRLMNSDKLDYDVADLESHLRRSRPSSMKNEEGGPQVASPDETPGRGVGGGSSFPPAGVARATLPFPSRSPMRRLDQLRELFRRYGKLTNLEVVQLLMISQKTVCTDLKILRNERFITKVEPNRSPRTHYFVLNENPDKRSGT